MDTNQLFRATRRRAPAIAFAAMAAAILTAILTLATPQQYRGTADVVVPLPPAATSPIAAVGQAVSDFDSALRSEVVATRVAQEADIKRGEVDGRLSSEQLAAGTIVEVTYVSDDPAIAETVAGAASREALVFLLEARLSPIEEQRSLAAADAQEASDAYVGFLQREGIVSPEEYFRDQQARIRRLNDEAAAAEAAGDIERAELLQARADARAAELAPLKDEFETLNATRVQAQARVGDAEDAFTVASAAVESARNGGSVEVIDAVPVARSAQLARRLLVAVVVATALAIATVVLLALLGLTEPQRMGPLGRPTRGDEEPPRGGDDGARRPMTVAPATEHPRDAVRTQNPATMSKRKRAAIAERARQRAAQAERERTSGHHVPPSGDAAAGSAE